MLWEIEWAVIQRMLIDSPGYTDEKEEKTKQTNGVNLQEQSSDDLMQLFQKHLSQ